MHAHAAAQQVLHQRIAPDCGETTLVQESSEQLFLSWTAESQPPPGNKVSDIRCHEDAPNNQRNAECFSHDVIVRGNDGICGFKAHLPHPSIEQRE